MSDGRDSPDNCPPTDTTCCYQDGMPVPDCIPATDCIPVADCIPAEDSIPVADIRRSQPIRSGMNPCDNFWSDDPNSPNYHPPMDSETEHRHQYIKPKIAERFQRKKDAWVPNMTKLDDLTNYRKDYMEKKVLPRKSCKPDSNVLQSGVPMNDTSTHRHDYQRWPCTKVKAFHPDNNLAPCGDMDLLSTNRVQFTEKPIAVRTSCKPLPNRGSLPKFDTSTESRDSYNKKEMGAVLRPTMKGEFVPSTAPLEDRTNYRMNYVGRNQPVRSSMKPCDTDWSGDHPPMDSETEHRHQYIKPKIAERFQRKKDAWVPNMTKLDDLTNYRKDYMEKKVLPRKSCKPDSNIIQSGVPMNDNSTHRHDYQRWPCTKVKAFHPDNNLAPCGDMDLLSTHRVQFTEKPIAVRTSCKPLPNRGSLPKFDTSTESRDSYNKKEMGPVLRPTMKGEFVPSTVPLEDLTNYRMNYVGRNQPVRSSMKPCDTDWSGDHPPMDSETEHRHQYIKQKIAERFQRKKDAWVPNMTKLDDLTNYRKDYMEKKVLPRKSCKPDSNVLQSGVPMNDTSTHRHDYQRWPCTKVQAFHPDNNLVPCGDMDLLSTNRVQFTEKPIAVRTSCKPLPNRGSLPKFDTSTESRDSYNKKEMGPVLRPTMKGEFIPSTVPLEDLTNYRMNYVVQNQPVRSSMKPCEIDWNGDEPMEGKTCYRHDYIPMAIPPRINKERDKYTPNAAKLEDKTVYRDHFTEKQARPRKSCKPSSTALHSEAPIENATTHRVDYKTWKTKRPDVVIPEGNLVNCGDMDFATSHRVFFTEKPICVRKPFKRAQRSLPGKFHGSTSYRKDFQDHKAPQPVYMHDTSVFKPSMCPLAHCTTYRSSFVRNQPDRRQLWAPCDNKRLLY